MSSGSNPTLPGLSNGKPTSPALSGGSSASPVSSGGKPRLSPGHHPRMLLNSPYPKKVLRISRKNARVPQLHSDPKVPVLHSPPPRTHWALPVAGDGWNDGATASGFAFPHRWSTRRGKPRCFQIMFGAKATTDQREQSKPRLSLVDFMKATKDCIGAFIAEYLFIFGFGFFLSPLLIGKPCLFSGCRSLR